jgi:putative ABC transport system ATP-binding protein
MLSLHNVSKTYRTAKSEIDALSCLDLEVADGAFVAIMGRSGSGKSTLLNILSLIDDATSGSFSFCGMQVVGLPEQRRVDLRRRYSSRIFEDVRLIDELTVRANVEIGILYRGLRPSDQNRRVEEAMDLAGIGHRASHPVNVLSAGQQRRVEIARALVSKPRIIFADEPAGILDGRAIDQLMRTLLKLNDMGTTVVMATHSAECAASAREIVYLVDGLRVKKGSSWGAQLRVAG